MKKLLAVLTAVLMLAALALPALAAEELIVEEDELLILDTEPDDAEPDAPTATGTDIPDGLLIDESSFPDPVFRQYVAENFDKDGDGCLSDRERLAVVDINVQLTGVRDMYGIANFPELLFLNCSFNPIDVLDLSGNPDLIALNAAVTGLEGIDLTPCPHLADAVREGEVLNVGYPVYYLPAEGRGPTEVWDAYGHRYEALASVAADAVTELGIDGRTAPWGTPIDESTFPDEAFRSFVLTNIDTSNNGYLSRREAAAAESMDCAALGIADLTGLELFPDLRRLCCAGNALTALTLPRCGLTYLDCSDNPDLTSLDLSGAPGLRLLSACGTGLTSLDLTVCPVLADTVTRGEHEQDGDCGAWYIASPKGSILLGTAGGEHILCSSAVIAPTSAVLPHTEDAPAVTLSEDGRMAQAVNFTGLYARVALVLDNNGVSGLYVTQVQINRTGQIVIPAFQVPGLKVTAVSIALVPTLEDIESPAPAVEASDYMVF